MPQMSTEPSMEWGHHEGPTFRWLVSPLGIKLKLLPGGSYFCSNQLGWSHPTSPSTHNVSSANSTLRTMDFGLTHYNFHLYHGKSRTQYDRLVARLCSAFGPLEVPSPAALFSLGFGLVNYRTHVRTCQVLRPRFPHEFAVHGKILYSVTQPFEWVHWVRRLLCQLALYLAL